MMSYMDMVIPHPRELGAEVIENMSDIRHRRVTLEDQIIRLARGVYEDGDFLCRGTTRQRIRQYTRRSSDEIAMALARLQAKGLVSLNAIRIPRNGKPSRRETVIVTAES